MASAAVSSASRYYTKAQLNSLASLLAQVPPSSGKDPLTNIRKWVNEALPASTDATNDLSRNTASLKHSELAVATPTAPSTETSDDSTANTGAGFRKAPSSDTENSFFKGTHPAIPSVPPAMTSSAREIADLDSASQIESSSLEVIKIMQEAQKISIWAWTPFKESRLLTFLRYQHHPCVLSDVGIVDLMQTDIDSSTHGKLLTLFSSIYTSQADFISHLIDLTNDPKLLQIYLQNLKNIFPPSERQEMMASIIGRTFNRINIDCCEVLIDKFFALGYSVLPTISDLYSVFSCLELDVTPANLMIDRQVLAQIHIEQTRYDLLYRTFVLRSFNHVNIFHQSYIEDVKKLVKVYFKKFGYRGSIDFLVSGEEWSQVRISITNWNDLLNFALANKNQLLFNDILKMSSSKGHEKMLIDLLKIYNSEYLDFLKILIEIIKEARSSSFDSKSCFNNAVCFAIESNNLIGLEALASLGVPLTKYESATHSPMQLAILKFSGQELLKILEIFRKYRVDFNEYSSPEHGIKQTALHCAVSKEDADAIVVAWLLYNGASRDQKTLNNKNEQLSTALELVKGKNPKIVTLFNLNDTQLKSIVEGGAEIGEENPTNDDAPLAALEMQLTSLQEKLNEADIQRKLAVIDAYDKLMSALTSASSSASVSKEATASISAANDFAPALNAVKFLREFINKTKVRIDKAKSTTDAEIARMQNVISACTEAVRSTSSSAYNVASSGMGAASNVAGGSTSADDLPVAAP